MYQDMTAAEVIADTIYDGVRLTTFRATFPRFILSEVNTHRAFSRNSASSRAIPVKRQIQLVEESPFMPVQWPINQSGMQANGFISDKYDILEGQNAWLRAAQAACASARSLDALKVHKQIASRLLEPFMWHTAIISSTQAGLDNFFLQRDHEDAQPEMATLARAMRKALDESTPEEAWVHIPFHTDKGSDGCGTFEPESAFIRAVARCARVSYGRELEEKTYEEDVALVERLIRSNHWSPLEHVGIVVNFPHPSYANNEDLLGNFDWPWSQLRHLWRGYLPTIAARVDSTQSL